MARINLLPWRQEERERKNREFITLVAGVLLLSLLGAGAAWSFFDNQLQSQQAANESIKVANAKLDEQLKTIETLEAQRDEIIARMKVIQDLQGRRPIPVKVWDDIARVIPPQLYLTNVKREDNVITFTGKADNLNVVSTFMRNLDGSEWLQNSELKNTQQKIAAYQGITVPPMGQGGASASYPENAYIEFVVTTNIRLTSATESSKDDQNADANGDTSAVDINSSDITTPIYNTETTPESNEVATEQPSQAVAPSSEQPVNNVGAENHGNENTPAVPTEDSKEQK